MSTKQGIICVVLAIMALAWILYCNTGARRVCAITEAMIEQQCHTIAECRVNDEGITYCWVFGKPDNKITLISTDTTYAPTQAEVVNWCQDIATKADLGI